MAASVATRHRSGSGSRRRFGGRGRGGEAATSAMAAAAAAAVVWRFAATAAQGGKNVSPATGWRADAAAAMASWGDLVHSPRASPPPPVCSASTWYLGKRHGVRVPGVAAAVAASPPCAGTGSGAHGHIRLHPGRRGPLGCALAILGGGKGVARLPRPPQRPHLWHSAWPRRRQRVGGMNRPRRSVSRRRWGAEVADWAERSASGGSFGFGGRRQRQRLSSGWQIGLPPSRGLPRPMERLRRASGRETRSPLTSHRHLFGTPCFCSLLRALVNARGSGALRRH